MKFPVLIVPFIPASGMALFPFIVLRKKQLKQDKYIMNHERIHLRQQLELLIIPFYIVYLAHYLFNLIRYKNHKKAYYQIVFEREAYAMDQDMNYLQHRRFWNWIRF